MFDILRFKKIRSVNYFWDDMKDANYGIIFIHGVTKAIWPCTNNLNLLSMASASTPVEAGHKGLVPAYFVVTATLI